MTKHLKKNIGYLIFSIVVVILPVTYADSQSLRITEFMYDAKGADPGKEYVEVINTGSESIDMAAVTFTEHGRNHTLKTNGGPLRPGAVAVIVPNPSSFTEHYAVETNIVDSTNFSLNNTGSTLELLLNGQTLHTVTYTKQNGANGTGDALHVSRDNTLTAKPPSPGQVSGAPRIKQNSGQTQSTAPSEETERSTESEEPGHVRITVHPEPIFLASETVFTAQQPSEDETYYGRWNFGDGSATVGETVTHAYLHPGTYIVTFQKLPTARERVRTEEQEPQMVQKEVTVIIPRFRAKRIDSAFIRLYNDHTSTINISGWKIRSGDETVFTLPEGSFAPAQGSTTIPIAGNPNTPIFIITKGGATISGNAPPIQQQKQTPQVTQNQKTSAKAALKTKPQEGTQKTTKDSAQKPEKTPQQNTTVRTSSKNQWGMAAIWIILFLGILAIAVAPMLLSHAEKQKED